MDESTHQERKYTPPEGAAVLMGDPLPRITAQVFADGLGECLSDHDLAEAISLVWSKTGYLMHLAEEDETIVTEFEEWFGLEEKLCQKAMEILVREGHHVDKGRGLRGTIAPFMERNGYRDACGWWVRDEDVADEGVADGRCPECGADLEDFVEGSNMGSRFPECGWSVVTTYLRPIQEDEQEYTITLMPGGAPSKEALRAISCIAMCNYVEAKKLMEGAPTALVAGPATQIFAHKNSLEKAGVPIEVRPGFPYDREGRLADEVRLNGLLLEAFPELTEEFDEYTSWQDGVETGCFLTYEDLLLPLARRPSTNETRRCSPGSAPSSSIS